MQGVVAPWIREAAREIQKAQKEYDHVAFALPQHELSQIIAAHVPPAEGLEEFGPGDLLYRHYQEYSSMVPPKGEPLLTYSGWLHKLSARLDREKNTPASATPESQGKEQV